jgi:hypothetical protein
MDDRFSREYFRWKGSFSNAQKFVLSEVCELYMFCFLEDGLNNIAVLLDLTICMGRYSLMAGHIVMPVTSIAKPFMTTW